MSFQILPLEIQNKIFEEISAYKIQKTVRKISVFSYSIHNKVYLSSQKSITNQIETLIFVIQELKRFPTKWLINDGTFLITFFSCIKELHEIDNIYDFNKFNILENIYKEVIPDYIDWI